MTLLQICCELKKSCTVLYDSVREHLHFGQVCDTISMLKRLFLSFRVCRHPLAPGGGFFIISATIARFSSVTSPVVLYHTGLIKSILFLIFFKIAIDKINNRAIIGPVVDTNNQRKEAIP